MNIWPWQVPQAPSYTAGSTGGIMSGAGGNWSGLTSYAVDVLGQLFAFGPTWDGYILSKMGRDELIDLGLAFRENSFASLTPEGVRVASEWGFSDRVMLEHPKWKQKLRR